MEKFDWRKYVISILFGVGFVFVSATFFSKVIFDIVFVVLLTVILFRVNEVYIRQDLILQELYKYLGHKKSEMGVKKEYLLKEINLDDLPPLPKPVLFPELILVKAKRNLKKAK